MTLAEPAPAPSLSPPRPTPGAEIPLERARGRVRLAFAADEGRTRIAVLHQEGSGKARFPNGVGAASEAILINTAGGLTGGDHFSYDVSVGAAAEVVVTTQAAERVYRQRSGFAEIETQLTVASSGRLDWLPQETILFDRSALRRTLSVDLAPDARFLGLEALVFGRQAMGESIASIALRDSWRLLREGRLVYADSLRLDGDATAILSGAATAGGARACATLVYVAPDAEKRLADLRAATETADGEAGATAWNGVLVGRFLAPSGQILRRDLMLALATLRSSSLPREWAC